MNAKERAEKIVAYMCPDTNVPSKDIEFVAAQIEEAEREASALAKGFGYMDGLSVGIDRGFKAAREKAAGIVEEFYDTREHNLRYLTDRIRKMEDK